eukprot:1612719-Alexandrium_andersonii.AAC.1
MLLHQRTVREAASIVKHAREIADAKARTWQRSDSWSAASTTGAASSLSRSRRTTRHGSATASRARDAAT